MAQRRNWRETVVKFKIYLEGGGDASVLRKRYAHAFHSILDPFCGNSRPRIVAKGSRKEAFEAFRIGINDESLDFVFLLVDSEDPVKDINKTWAHLAQRKDDRWPKPSGADDEHVFLMTTAIETWILADLKVRKKENVSEELEKMIKQQIIRALSKDTKGRYDKSVDQQAKFIAEINPINLLPLPSFARVRRILKEKLSS